MDQMDLVVQQHLKHQMDLMVLADLLDLVDQQHPVVPLDLLDRQLDQKDQLVP
jgi:hypothetical protein